MVITGCYGMQDTQAALYCFNMALSVYPRSRYALLSLGLMEKANGNIERARELLKRGARYNPTDAALRQVHARGCFFFCILVLYCACSPEKYT